MLTVTLISHDPEDGFVEDEHDFSVDFVSLYNGGTHGPPALVAPGREQGRSVAPTARPGQSVLYINTAIVPAYKIVRGED
jgi:hypothetical protein